MKLLKTTIPFIVMFLLLIAVELCCFLYLGAKGLEESLFFRKDDNQYVGLHSDTYSQIDPLLGWSINNKFVNFSDAKVENNCNVLSSFSANCTDTLVLYVSGGSTSDITFDQENWPKSLLRLLEEKQICTKIYIAAVAGYSSGQEVLKTLRDVHAIHPDLHLSYSGANEINGLNYVSDFEIGVYSKILAGPKFLPNTLKVLQSNLSTPTAFSYPTNRDPNEFWEQNMKTLDAIATSNNYEFIGILQPVFNYQKHLDSSNETLKQFALSYKGFFPKAKTSSTQYDYLYDYSSYFDTFPSGVFKDDCHLATNTYQDLVAEEIYVLLDKTLSAKKDSL